MTTRLSPTLRDQRGVTMAELLVALAVFALFVLIIDAIFVGARRGSRKAELAADVQQNARIVMERLTREIRESNQAQISTGGSAGKMAVVFRSPRLATDPPSGPVFCLFARNNTDPATFYNAGCFTSVGVTGPNYTGNPTCPAGNYGYTTCPLGTYIPLWQQYVGYYMTNPGVDIACTTPPCDLRRVWGQLTAPLQALPSPTSLTGGDIIASYVQSFDVSLSTSTFTSTLWAEGTAIVQGTPVPAQDIWLQGKTLMRN